MPPSGRAARSTRHPGRRARVGEAAREYRKASRDFDGAASGAGALVGAGRRRRGPRGRVRGTYPFHWRHANKQVMAMAAAGALSLCSNRPDLRRVCATQPGETLGAAVGARIFAHALSYGWPRHQPEDVCATVTIPVHRVRPDAPGHFSAAGCNLSAWTPVLGQEFPSFRPPHGIRSRFCNSGGLIHRNLGRGLGVSYGIGAYFDNSPKPRGAIPRSTSASRSATRAEAT